jgi:hypothetical protein
MLLGSWYKDGEYCEENRAYESFTFFQDEHHTGAQLDIPRTTSEKREQMVQYLTSNGMCRPSR